MIPTKSRRFKGMKLTRNLERVYKEGKCRECAVVLTRMDFAKILGRFTKVKIQYESSTPKGKTNEISRYRSHENGVVHKNNNQQRSPKSVTSMVKSKTNDIITTSILRNVLKENNRIKNSIIKDTNFNYESKATIASELKQYSVVFINPIIHSNTEAKNEISLVELLPKIDHTILPSDDWSIDYFPKNEEPKDDKVYDRIAAELEDLMNSGEPLAKSEDKADDFPSIMDILNDNGSVVSKPSDQSSAIDFKPELESNDVEAMLLGKSNDQTKPTESTPMEVDNPDMSSLIPDVEQFNAIQTVIPSGTNLTDSTASDIDNPHSPSILDEALQKGIEEHLPPSNQNNATQEHKESNGIKSQNDNVTQITVNPVIKMEITTSSKGTALHQSQERKDSSTRVQNGTLASKAAFIAQIVFKKTKDGQCEKAVTCMKNLIYNVEIDGKSVEFLGAPKTISSLKDLQILLQIVNESELESVYVLQ